MTCQLLTGEIPYKFDPDERFDERVFMFKLGKNGSFGPTHPTSLPKVAYDFVSKCLVRDPTKRPTAGELLQHPFMIMSPQSDGMLCPHDVEWSAMAQLGLDGGGGAVG